MDIKVDISNSQISQDEILKGREEANIARDKLWSGHSLETGWVKLPKQNRDEEIKDILNTAKEIKEKCQLFIAIGIGGSYLGSKAVIDAINSEDESFPEVAFAGYNLDKEYHQTLLKKIEDKDSCICVISKSGGTIETKVAYGILKEAIEKKYGKEEASKRIYVITGEDSKLKEEATENSYKLFYIPKNIGGRYSALTAVGLLPMAVAGVDIKKLLEGAKVMCETKAWDKEGMDYAIARVCLKNKGKVMEIFEYFSPRLESLGEWIKQLFAESEGKEGKGIFPSALNFPRDLHSIGQFLQQGNQIFFETMLMVEGDFCHLSKEDLKQGKFTLDSMEKLNKCVEKGVIEAHKNAKIPLITMDIWEINEYNLGQLLYFFETTCAISAYMENINPFDQPGVEDYKEEMKKEIMKVAK